MIQQRMLACAHIVAHLILQSEHFSTDPVGVLHDEVEINLLGQVEDCHHLSILALVLGSEVLLNLHHGCLEEVPSWLIVISPLTDH